MSRAGKCVIVSHIWFEFTTSDWLRMYQIVFSQWQKLLKKSKQKKKQKQNKQILPQKLPLWNSLCINESYGMVWRGKCDVIFEHSSLLAI